MVSALVCCSTLSGAALVARGARAQARQGGGVVVPPREDGCPGRAPRAGERCAGPYVHYCRYGALDEEGPNRSDVCVCAARRDLSVPAAGEQGRWFCGVVVPRGGGPLAPPELEG